MGAGEPRRNGDGGATAPGSQHVAERLTAGDVSTSTQGADGAPAATAIGTVFVSYRVRPDEPIAAALKTLLEATIDPRPMVWVSGLGGILPSEETSRAQIQSAAQIASAFVAVITEHSKDREWIFFEAGAAWGRRVLYAPFLVNVMPDALPNTLQAYQVTPYDDERKVLELIGEVAARVKGAVKLRAFPQRYRAFANTMAEHLNLKRPSEETGRERTLDYAIELIFENSDAAKAILDDFAPNSSSLRDDVALWRIRATPGLTTSDRLERLERETHLHSLPMAKLFFAEWEPSPHRALTYAQEALALHGSSDSNAYGYRWALDIATKNLKTLGRSAEATTLLRAALRDSRRLVRAKAALGLAEQTPEMHSLGRAALASYAVASHPIPDTLIAACRLLHGAGLPALHVHVSRVADSEVRSAESAHWLGLAFMTEGTHSLAYRALRRAAEGGLQLASVNIASLFAQGAVHAAGLELFATSPGPYEAASSKYPFAVRAELEEAVQAEESRGDTLAVRGKAQFAALVATMDRALAEAKELEIRPGYYRSVSGRTYEVESHDNGTFVIWVTDQIEKKRAFIVTNDCPFAGLATVDGSEKGLLYAHDAHGEFMFQWFREDGDPVVREHVSPQATPAAKELRGLSAALGLLEAGASGTSESAT
jgi:hypothetical protein